MKGARAPRRALAEPAALAVVLIVVGGLSLLPLATLLARALTPDWLEAVGSRSVVRAATHSLVSSTAAALLATGIGTALALLLSLGRVRARGALMFCLLLPMMIPPHVTAIAWTQALGPGSSVLGLLGLARPAGSPNPVQTPAGLVALLALQQLPTVVLLVRTALRGLPAELAEAARVAGARRVRIVRRIVLPLLAPTLVAAATLAFIGSIGNFGINALIGVPARYTTLPVLLWQRLSSYGPGVLGEVAAVASVLVGLALALVPLSWWLLSRSGTAVEGGGRPFTLDTPAPGRRRGPTPAEALLWLTVAATLAFPLAALAATSIVPTYGVALDASTATLAHYAEVLGGQSVTLRAFGNSALLATLAAGAIALVSVLLARLMVPPSAVPGHGAGSGRGIGAGTGSGIGRRLAAAAAVVADLAYAVPGIVMSIAFILLFIRPLPVLGTSLYGTLTLIGLAYVGTFLAIGLKPVAAAAAGSDPALDDAARVAGAAFGRRLLRIHAPALVPAAVSGATLVFLTAYNEITVSALLWSSGNETIGTVIFNYEDGGYTTLAAAMSMLTVAATAAIMLLATRFARRAPAGTLPWAG